MKAELEKLVKAERKWKRELAELRALRKRQSEYAQSDPKVLAMIDAEIAAYLKK